MATKQLAVQLTKGNGETTTFLLLLIVALTFLLSSRWGAVWSVITGQPATSAPLTSATTGSSKGLNTTQYVTPGTDTSTKPIAAIPGAMPAGQSPSLSSNMGEALRLGVDDAAASLGTMFTTIIHGGPIL